MKAHTPTFGETLFGNAPLGDRRRTKRLVLLADELCKHPGGSLPEKLHSPQDLKALYRLANCPDCTHENIMASVGPAVLTKIDDYNDTVLILHDTTELDFTSHKSLADQLGQIGNGNGRGLLCHNSLAVKAGSREVIGLISQVLHYRVQAPKVETLPERRARESRESLLWLQGTARLPADRRLVDVADQGADTFEFLEHEVHSGRRFVIRSHHDRKISVGQEAAAATGTVQAYARGLPAIGSRSIAVAAQPAKGRRPARPARQAHLQISAGAVLVHPPHAKHGNHGNEPLALWVVRVWEPQPPKGAKAIEWFLLTNEPVQSLADAERVINWYQTRWVIEEYHKAMKTGCRIEEMQFTDTARLEPMIAILSTVATTLLNLRAMSELPDAKTRPAKTLIDSDYVEVLSAWRYGTTRDLTVHEFFFALARLGGHQNRPSDKRPGWIVLWRGWTRLQAMLDGVQAIKRKKCG
jgi:hypothetical protein